MSIYFLDSSALVKRYVTETGSTWIRALTDSGTRNPLIIARITWVEVLSALARRQPQPSPLIRTTRLSHPGMQSRLVYR